MRVCIHVHVRECVRACVRARIDADAVVDKAGLGVGNVCEKERCEIT